MTGESDPVKKDSNQPFLLSGCKVEDGQGTMLVTGVGTHTEWGQVMAAISHDNGEETPLQVNFNFVTELHFQIWFPSVCSYPNRLQALLLNKCGSFDSCYVFFAAGSIEWSCYFHRQSWIVCCNSCLYHSIH
jgi:hypothetical protein